MGTGRQMRRRRETDDLLNLHFTNISSVYPASRKPEKLGTANTKYKPSSLQDHIILEIIYSPMFGVADECAKHETASPTQ